MMEKVFFKTLIIFIICNNALNQIFIIQNRMKQHSNEGQGKKEISESKALPFQLYLHPHTNKTKHRRMKTDQICENNIKTQSSTSALLEKLKLNSKERKKKYSTSEVDLVSKFKNYNAHGKSANSVKKERDHENTINSLKKLRNGIGSMNPQKSMEEHRKICEKTKERKGLEGYEIIEEYEKLTNELLQKMQKMKEENAKEKKEIQIKSQRYNNKITDKVNELVSKNYHYSLILSVLKKKGVNVEEMCYKECVHKTNF